MSTESAGPRIGDSSDIPTVSVLIAAWNEADRIEACLIALDSISWPNLQVLVSAGGPDGTFEKACRHVSSRLSVIEQRPGMGKQAALRELYSLACGEIIYLTDGDTIVSEETLRSVLEPLIAGDAQAVTGYFRPYKAAASIPLVYYQWSIDHAVNRHRGAESEGITGANAAVTRTALDHAGRFDTDVKTGTDYVLARQLRSRGYAIRYVGAAVETEYAESAGPYLTRRSRWLRNTFQHGRTLGDQQEVRNSLITMIMGVAFLGGPATILLKRRLGSVAWGALAGLLLKRRLDYAAALAAEEHATPPPRYLVQVPYLLLLDQLASVMAVMDLLSRQRRTRW